MGSGAITVDWKKPANPISHTLTEAMFDGPGNLFWTFILYCPAVFGHFSPAPVKTDRAVRIQ